MTLCATSFVSNSCVLPVVKTILAQSSGFIVHRWIGSSQTAGCISAAHICYLKATNNTHKNARSGEVGDGLDVLSAY